MVHRRLNAEGLYDLAPVLQLAALSREVRQGQESLDLHVNLHKHTIVAA